MWNAKGTERKINPDIGTDPPNTTILSVVMLRQAKQSECGTGWLSYKIQLCLLKQNIIVSLKTDQTQTIGSCYWKYTYCYII